MEGMEAYQTFTALKLHFTGTYDYFKYNGALKKINEDKVSSRKDFFHFRRIERKYKDELVPFIASNLVSGRAKWIGDLVSVESEKTYVEWKKHQESFKYFFKLDLEVLTEYDVKTMWDADDGNHPQFLKLYLGKKISLDTFVAADEVLNFIPRWNKQILDTIIWPDIARLAQKYRPFLKLNKMELKKIMKETLVG